MKRTLRGMKDIQYFSGALGKEGATHNMQTPWVKKLLALSGFQTVCLKCDQVRNVTYCAMIFHICVSFCMCIYVYIYREIYI